MSRTQLLDATGSPKLVRECTYPLTGLGCVSTVYTVYTDHGIFEVGPGSDTATARATFGVSVDLPLTTR